MPVRKEDVPDDVPGMPSDCDCPRLDPDDWDGVENDWSDITFVRTTTSAVLGVPVGFDSSREQLRKKASRAGANVPEDAMLLIGSGKFRRPILLEVEDAPDGAKGIERPGGIAFTRLLPAPWGELPKVVERTRKEAREKYGRDPDDTWVWYLTCRVCSNARQFETLIVAHYREGS
jgi:hypothetical protein